MCILWSTGLFTCAKKLYVDRIKLAVKVKDSESQRNENHLVSQKVYPQEAVRSPLYTQQANRIQTLHNVWLYSLFLLQP